MGWNTGWGVLICRGSVGNGFLPDIPAGRIHRLSSSSLVLGGFAIVVVEKSSYARPCSDYALAPSHLLVCMNDAATQSLVVSLEVVVLHVLFDEQAKVLLPKGDDFAQALGLDGQDETFGEGVQIRTPCRQSDWIRTAILEHVSETGRVQRVSVHAEISDTPQEALEGIGQIASPDRASASSISHTVEP